MAYRLSIEDMKKMAIERGGKCLSEQYRGLKGTLKWQCNLGHIWEASVESVRSRKSWCPECRRENQIRNLGKHAQFKHPVQYSESGEKLRVCNMCKVAKPHSEMVKAKARTDGIRSICKECRKGVSRKRREMKALELGKEMMPYVEKPFSNLSNEELLEHLRRFERENGRPPTSIDLENNPNYPHAYTYYRRFKYWNNQDPAKSWLDILNLAGIDPIDYDKIWTSWEYLVEVACEKLRGKCLFQPGKLIKGYRPDIVILNEKTIVDAATSNYRGKHKERQYRLAIEAGYSIEFWCLYRTSINGINKPEIKYVFSEQIAQQLIEIGEIELSQDILELLKKHDNYAEKIIARKSEQIISGLWDFYNKYGRSPQWREFNRNAVLPSLYGVKKIYGTLNNALNVAGLPTNRKDELKIVDGEFDQLNNLHIKDYEIDYIA